MIEIHTWTRKPFTWTRSWFWWEFS